MPTNPGNSNCADVASLGRNVLSQGVGLTQTNAFLYVLLCQPRCGAETPIGGWKVLFECRTAIQIAVQQRKAIIDS
ncbi:hypothetical protein E5D57_012035 [Metarhizium anisopliae]|nr:hypothetical protein E5D57_012035 [Metarhizium anisopliae]